MSFLVFHIDCVFHLSGVEMVYGMCTCLQQFNTC